MERRKEREEVGRGIRFGEERNGENETNKTYGRGKNEEAEGEEAKEMK